jgi:hypothetical protein
MARTKVTGGDGTGRGHSGRGGRGGRGGRASGGGRNHNGGRGKNSNNKPTDPSVTDQGNPSRTRTTRSKGPASQVPCGLTFAPSRKKPPVASQIIQEHPDSDSDKEENPTPTEPLRIPGQHDYAADPKHDDCKIVDADGSDKYVQAMFGGGQYNLTAQDTYKSLMVSGIKTETQFKASLHNELQQQFEATPTDVPTRPKVINPYASSKKKLPVQQEINPRNDQQDQPPPPHPQEDTVMELDVHNTRLIPSQLDPATALRNEMEATGNGNGMDFEVFEAEATCQRGQNTTGYEYKKAQREIYFFDTIHKYGGNSLGQLTKKVPSDYSGRRTEDFSFYNIVGGPKNHDKHFLLNKCLVVCAVKWVVRKGSPDKIGKPLQPGSLRSYFQELFSTFKDKGVQYKYDVDFNHKGGFHGVVIEKWEAYRKIDPTFGTKPNEAQFMPDSDKRVRTAIEKGILDQNNPAHLRLIVMYFVGRYCALRGNKEYHDLLIDHIYLGRFTGDEGDEEHRGQLYVGIWVPWSKAHQLTFKKVVAQDKKKALLVIVENRAAGIMNPYPYFLRYLSQLHPEGKKFIAKPCFVDSHLKEWRKQWPEKDITFFPYDPNCANHNVGINSIPTLFKTFARLCGAPNWDACTGQGLRKLCLTIAVDNDMHPVDVAALARHHSLNSQQHYIKHSEQRKEERSRKIQSAPEVPLKRQDKKSSPQKKKPASSSPKLGTLEPINLETIDHWKSPRQEQASPLTNGSTGRSSLSDSERKELVLLRENERLRGILSKQTAPKNLRPPRHSFPMAQLPLASPYYGGHPMMPTTFSYPTPVPHGSLPYGYPVVVQAPPMGHPLPPPYSVAPTPPMYHHVPPHYAPIPSHPLPGYHPAPRQFDFDSHYDHLGSHPENHGSYDMYQNRHGEERGRF